MSAPSVYTHSDYRAFLKAYYQFKKASRGGFSLAAFAGRVGLNSDTYLKQIIDGKRDLTVANIFKVAKGLRMTPLETSFFEALVLLNQATTPEEEKQYSSRLRELARSRPKRAARMTGHQLFSEPYFAALLVLIDGSSEEAAVSMAKTVLGLDEGLFWKVVKKMMDAGFLTVEQDQFKMEYSHQVFVDQFSNQATMKRLLEHQLMLSVKMLEQAYGKGPKFYSQTFKIKKSDLESYEHQIQTLLSAFASQSDESCGEEIAQLNVQMFTLEPALAHLWRTTP